jgi:pimeloyl-ACP methyl ester carboxylesterase
MPITLAHQSLGAGPPLVILHGLFGSGRNWQGVARRLAGAHTVHLFDLPNHGDSPHGQAMDYPFLAGCVWQTCETLGLEGVRLLGHSMGGKVAISCAAQRPDAVQALVVEDIAPVAYPDRLSPTLAALRTLDLATLVSRTEGDLRLARELANGQLRQFLLHGLAGGPGDWHWRFDLAALAAGLPEVAAPPQCPATPLATPLLVVSGEHSPYVDAAGRAAYARHFTNWREVILPGCGHWPHAESPDRFVAIVTDFLAELPRPP